MLQLRTIILLCLVLSCIVTRAQASTILTANLTHSQETTQGILMTSTGDPRPESFGTARFILNSTMTALTFSATIFNIDVTGLQTPNDANDNLVAAHIHAPVPGPGSNAPVRWGFFGTPDNDNAPDDLVVMPFASGVGGTFTSKWDASEGNGGTTLTAQLSNILSDFSYINFHTTQFGGGEIRGQILVVPEPSSLFLLGSGLAAIIVLGRKRFYSKV